jgi:hypothetical protein
MAHVCLGLVPCAEDPAPKVFCEGRETSGARLYSGVAAVSCYLTQELNVCIGDRVALLAYNTDQFVEALLACADSGAICCPMNWRWSEAEVSSAMRTIDAKILLVGYHSWHVVSRLRLPSTVTAVLLSEPCREPDMTQGLPVVATDRLIQQYPAARLQLLRPPSDAAVICFTSGTHSSCHVSDLPKRERWSCVLSLETARMDSSWPPWATIGSPGPPQATLGHLHLQRCLNHHHTHRNSSPPHNSVTGRLLARPHRNHRHPKGGDPDAHLLPCTVLGEAGSGAVQCC